MDILLTSLQKELEQSRQEFLSSVQALTGDMLKRKKTADSWSIIEIMHHIYLSESLINNLLDKLINKYGFNVKGAGAGLERFTIKNESLVAMPNESFLSGMPVKGTEPDSDNSKNEVVALLESSRKRTMQNIDLGKNQDLTGITFPHSRIGNLNFYEWLLVILKHENAHIGQIKAVLDK
jgi:uncharacterized damage-inducible protein DinB